MSPFEGAELLHQMLFAWMQFTRELWNITRPSMLYMNRAGEYKDQKIFDACHISATCVSTPKWFFYYWTQCLYPYISPFEGTRLLCHMLLVRMKFTREWWNITRPSMSPLECCMWVQQVNSKTKFLILAISQQYKSNHQKLFYFLPNKMFAFYTTIKLWRAEIGGAETWPASNIWQQIIKKPLI